MGPLSKPAWTRGLKLTSRHFQAQDRYHEDLVRFALRMAVDQPWGISELAIDEEAVATGQLRVRRMTAVLPDGTPVLTGGDGAIVISPRSFERRLQGRASLDAYVALSAELPGQAAVEEAGATSRFIQEESLVADYNTGRSPLPILWARPNVRIVFEDESLDGCVGIRVARLLSVQGGAQLDPLFIPPVLRLHASGALHSLLQSIERKLVAALSAVGGSRAAGTEMTGSEAARLLLASVLGRTLPALRSLLLAEGAHPREAYRVVAALVGSISAFIPPYTTSVPAFDYLNLRATFGVLEKQAREILDALSTPTHQTVSLSRCDENLSRGLLREPGIFGKEFLLVLAGGDPAAMHAHVPRVAKVTAWEDVGEAVQGHLAGVPLIPELRRPHGLELPPHAACFRLDKRSPAWTSIVKHGSVAVWLPTGFTQLQPTLLAQDRGPFA